MAFTAVFKKKRFFLLACRLVSGAAAGYLSLPVGSELRCRQAMIVVCPQVLGHVGEHTTRLPSN